MSRVKLILSYCILILTKLEQGVIFFNLQIQGNSFVIHENQKDKLSISSKLKGYICHYSDKIYQLTYHCWNMLEKKKISPCTMTASVGNYSHKKTFWKIVV